MKTSLVLVLAFLATMIPATATQAATKSSCNVAAVSAQALPQLGETKTEVRVFTPAQMTDDGMTGYVAYADPDRITISSEHECKFVKSTIAHEVTHVWQFRAGAKTFVPEDEIVADCAAVLTHWTDYSPYLTERGSGCTPVEFEQATTLKGWAR